MVKDNSLLVHFKLLKQNHTLQFVLPGYALQSDHKILSRNMFLHSDITLEIREHFLYNIFIYNLYRLIILHLR